MSFATTAIAAACTAQTMLASPLGPLLLARTHIGLAGVWFMRQKDHPGDLAAPTQPDDPLLRRAEAQLQRYFAGAKDGFDLPLDLLGTPFQRAVWQALLRIPIGQTKSYGAIAREVGTAQAVRAVGAAVGKNPLGVIVPCHRVIGSNGALTGYAAGLERKTALLELEGARFNKASAALPFECAA
ncbi:MAG: cysteine methyltransferase [Methylibium sp. NZG]|nr:MAG: cysteine methyltransferase [Methylibium sp. NZG]